MYGTSVSPWFLFVRGGLEPVQGRKGHDWGKRGGSGGICVPPSLAAVSRTSQASFRELGPTGCPAVSLPGPCWRASSSTRLRYRLCTILVNQIPPSAVPIQQLSLTSKTLRQHIHNNTPDSAQKDRHVGPLHHCAPALDHNGISGGPCPVCHWIACPLISRPADRNTSSASIEGSPKIHTQEDLPLILTLVSLCAPLTIHHPP